MKMKYLLFACLSLIVITSCSNDVTYLQEENEIPLYIDTGKEIRKVTNTEKEKLFSAISKDVLLPWAKENLTRSSDLGERTIVAFGYQKDEAGKPKLRVFDDTLRKEIGLPPGYYVVSIHTITKTLSSEIGAEITPMLSENYIKSKYKKRMGFSPDGKGITFATNLQGKTKTKEFQGTTQLYYFHSDVLGRQGYKRWYPCAPEELVWVYRERIKEYNWDI